MKSEELDIRRVSDDAVGLRRRGRQNAEKARGPGKKRLLAENLGWNEKARFCEAWYFDLPYLVSPNRLSRECCLFTLTPYLIDFHCPWTRLDCAGILHIVKCSANSPNLKTR
jgi:hypothetical protein